MCVKDCVGWIRFTMQEKTYQSCCLTKYRFLNTKYRFRESKLYSFTAWSGSTRTRSCSMFTTSLELQLSFLMAMQASSRTPGSSSKRIAHTRAARIFTSTMPISVRAAATNKYFIIVRSSYAQQLHLPHPRLINCKDDCE